MNEAPVLEDIPLERALAFLSTHHRSAAPGNLPKTKVTAVGLSVGSELCGVALFSYPRTKAKQRKYTTELLRLAFAEGVRVPNGASMLIGYYRKRHHPSDLFTYQDTSRENSTLYKAAGMRLAQDGTSKRKQYLVAPEKTLDTAVRGEYYSIGEVSRRGPDALLGVKLGEVYHSDGRRKTNPELFLEELGWHLEETSGDSVWEWFNPNVSFYTYKITSPESNKYYFGVKKVNRPRISEDFALNDNYWGSGGIKFKTWYRKHSKSAVKEIMGIFSTHAQAKFAEKKLIGELYKTDPNCLNSLPGGFVGYGLITVTKEEECPTHGVSKYQKGQCLKCRTQAAIDKQDCPVHGNTTHLWGHCRACTAAKTLSTKWCGFEGKETQHAGQDCISCRNAKSRSKMTCSMHGESPHVGKTCLKCSHGNSATLNTCPVHGVTAFRKEKCQKCAHAKKTSERECPTHGLTSFIGDKCYKCVNAKVFVLAECETHGETKHRGGKCSKCENGKHISIKKCPTHGETKHHKDACYKCRSSKRS